MNGTMNIEMVGEDFKPNPNRSQIERGPLTLPEGTVYGGGDLIAFGENDTHLHCMTSAGAYVGIFKSNDTGHIWGVILRHNYQL